MIVELTDKLVDQLVSGDESCLDPQQKAIICDIDGTASLMIYAPDRRGPYDWDRVGEDEPNLPILGLVNMLRDQGYTVIWVSGRDEVCRHLTHEWLRLHDMWEPGDPLFMRPRMDDRPDTVVKAEIFHNHIEGCYQVDYVLDDRNCVVAMWRGLGLTVLQVADGDF